MFRCIKNLKSLLFIAVLALPLICLGLPQDHVIRAAIDIGSGATKLKVVEIDLKTQKIEKVLVNESFPVQYQEELEKSENNTFNNQVMDTGLQTLKKSKEIALKHQAQKVIAVATASFRKASNVQEFIDKIYRETGIKVYIIDQNLEGILAFEATVSQFDVAPQNLVVWDIGGGSFQFSTLDQAGNITVYRGDEASIPFKNRVIKAVKMKDPSIVTNPNPLTQEEIHHADYIARQSALKVDEFFKNKISNPNTKIVGIGNIFAYGIYPLVGKKSPFSQKELFEKVQSLADKTDQELGGGAYVNVAATNSILVLGFMQTLKIYQMDVMDINNADGALTYPAFWEEGASEKEVRKDLLPASGL